VNTRTLAVTGAAIVVALGVSGGAVALASSSGSDTNISGPDADRAVQAALVETGGGTANSVELDHEDGATWEVEVTKPDGSTVDIRLDGTFRVVTVESDHESGANDAADG
jgi:hypothetical protein